MKTLFLDDTECQLLREVLDFVSHDPRYVAFVIDLRQRIPESAARSVGEHYELCD